MKKIKRICLYLSGILFPLRCPMCAKPIGSDSMCCGECTVTKDPLVKTLNVRACEGKILNVYAPHYYTGMYRKSIYKFKFRRKKDYATALSKMMVFSANEKINHGDMVACVPMIKDKSEKRPYNHSELLARGVAQELGIPYLEVLKKIKKNKTQHILNKSARIKNVKGAFAINVEIDKKNVILVDDIITTGETLRECAEVLYRAGAASVTALCAAKTPREKS